MGRKDTIALELANAHRNMEPTINRIVRLITESESDESEPVKLLEVNPATSPSGIFPIAFAADPPTIPYPSVVIEVTEEEFELISTGKLALPFGWHLDETIYPAIAR
jgi:hypothetical protein